MELFISSADRKSVLPTPIYRVLIIVIVGRVSDSVTRHNALRIVGLRYR